MFKKFNLASSLVGLYLFVKTASSSPYEVTVFEQEDVSMLSEEQPLSIHVSPEALSPEVVEKLGTSSNIIFTDLPNSPQFVSIKDYESMMFATNELLDELLQQNRSNDNNNQIEDSLNQQDRENYESVHKIYDGTLHEGDQPEEHKEHEEEKEEPPTEKFTSTSTIMETQPEPTVTETESTCHESDSSSTYSSPTSTFAESTPCSTSTEMSSECSHCSSIHTSEKNHHKTSASVTVFRNSTESSTHPTFTSKSFGKHRNYTKIQHPKLNHTNYTNQTTIGFHNASSSIMPTTMFFAFLISILVFAQMC
ncbi:hypothetical protein ZYGR_0S01750 [Zygosaccharomyces rouxii]|uniref:Uncharacterized protein n=1 Tax=Zygosaccharomyces rouxii TaxID=4956 RepID=A0A1Q3A2U2_ZYGRO|nr:hypothetical protein ZYGR_0S01750 [Zygosaccharomyces rouxii]